jgi:hypothetical protein
MIKIYDANGMTWTFNKEQSRFYCLEAEKEIPYNEEDPYVNGYYCRSWEEGIEYLNEDGYMDK